MFGTSPSRYKVERSIELFIEACTNTDTARMAKEIYPEDVEVIADIPYMNDDSVYHKMDLYVPKKLLTSGNDPLENKIYDRLVLDIHGGGFVYGLKEINKCCNMTVASQNSIPVASINYNLAPKFSIVNMHNEICSAIEFLTKNYGVKEIYIMGDSAGGYLALTTWANIVSEEIRKDFKCKVAPSVDVKGLVLICPAARDDSKYLEGIEDTFFIDTPEEYLPVYARQLTNVVDKVLASGIKIPNTVLITSDHDFLHDETLDLADFMTSRGCKTSVFDGVTKEDGNDLTHVYVVGHPEWEESRKPLELISGLILE